MAGFFAERKCRGPAVLTPPVLVEVQELLNEGSSIPDIALKLKLKADTLHKAVRAGKLHKPQKKRKSPSTWIVRHDQSGRSVIDALAPIGMGATDTSGRLAASIFGLGPAEPFFAPCLDIAGGGVLLGLPGLLSMGLLSHSELFTLPPGYYRRSCQGIQRKSDGTSPPLRCSPATVPSCHDRLLGKCHGRPLFLW